MPFIILCLILLSVAINTVAQLCLKLGMESIGQFNFSLTNFLSIAWQIAFNPWIIFGMLCYVISVVVWLLVLSRINVSIAYPMASLGYVTTAFAAYFFLGENVSLLRIIGIFVILLGVFLVARS